MAIYNSWPPSEVLREYRMAKTVTVVCQNENESGYVHASCLNKPNFTTCNVRINKLKYRIELWPDMFCFSMPKLCSHNLVDFVELALGWFT